MKNKAVLQNFLLISAVAKRIDELLKKNNLTQLIGYFFDEAELTIIAGTAQGICKDRVGDYPLVE